MPGSNANQYLAGVSTGFLDYCRPHSCAVLAQWQQFTTGPNGAWIPAPNSEALVAELRNDIGGNLDKVSALYMLDEPYDKGLTGAELQTAADQLRRYFPNQSIMLILSGPSVTYPTATIPSGVDWVGFDWYCQSQSTLSATLAALDAKLPTPYEQLYLVVPLVSSTV